MAEIHLHNTLSGKVEPFRPLEKNKVGIYVCGVTPYDDVHLGHARCYVTFDVLKRLFKHDGYAVSHIQNFTDVDDKIIARAKDLGLSPAQLADRHIGDYFEWMEKLNILRADQYPRVTENIEEIKRLIGRLLERELAYVAGGDVFYAVRRFLEYGHLSKRRVDHLEAGARVEVNEKKRDPLDFALWKVSKEGEPAWDSPWSRGRPGWHIECSAMAMRFLGESFDIHGGGQDLIFPHHENEIAQSNGATGQKAGFARFWVHNGFVTVNKEKMSKSLGNFFTLRDIFAKYDPMTVRYFLISQHYRSPLNFSDTELNVAQVTWRERISGALELLEHFEAQASGTREVPQWVVNERAGMKDKFMGDIRNDLNTPAALGSLHQFCSWVYQFNESEAIRLKKTFWRATMSDLLEMLEVLGLKRSQDSWEPELLKLVEDREEARRAKDWKRSDNIRMALKMKGVLLEDTPTGPRLKRV